MISSRHAIFVVFVVVLVSMVLAAPVEKSRRNSDKANRRDDASVKKTEANDEAQKLGRAEANDEAQKLRRSEAEQNDQQSDAQNDDPSVAQNDAQQDSVNFNSVEGNLNVKTWN